MKPWRYQWTYRLIRGGTMNRSVTMPAVVLLEFLVLTHVDPNWLLTGEGEQFIARSESLRPRPARPDRLFEIG